MGVGLKLTPFINPVCGQLGKPCPDIYKKVWHLYLSFMLLEIDLLTRSTVVGLKSFEMALLTLFLGVRLK